jgi:hypothetical protein
MPVSESCRNPRRVEIRVVSLREGEWLSRPELALVRDALAAWLGRRRGCRGRLRLRLRPAVRPSRRRARERGGRRRRVTGRAGPGARRPAGFASLARSVREAQRAGQAEKTRMLHGEGVGVSESVRCGGLFDDNAGGPG